MKYEQGSKRLGRPPSVPLAAEMCPTAYSLAATCHVQTVRKANDLVEMTIRLFNDPAPIARKQN